MKEGTNKERWAVHAKLEEIPPTESGALEFERWILEATMSNSEKIKLIARATAGIGGLKTEYRAEALKAWRAFERNNPL